MEKVPNDDLEAWARKRVSDRSPEPRWQPVMVYRDMVPLSMGSLFKGVTEDRLLTVGHNFELDAGVPHRFTMRRLRPLATEHEPIIGVERAGGVHQDIAVCRVGMIGKDMPRFCGIPRERGMPIGIDLIPLAHSHVARSLLTNEQCSLVGIAEFKYLDSLPVRFMILDHPAYFGECGALFLDGPRRMVQVQGIEVNQNVQETFPQIADRKHLTLASMVAVT